MFNPPTFDLTKFTIDFFKKTYLTGLTFYQPDAEGNPVETPSDFFQYHLDQALAKLGDMTNVDVLERINTSEQHDFFISEYKQFCFIPLSRMPCLFVNEVRAVYPTGETLQVFPSEWVRLDKIHSQINLIPTSGTMAQIMVGRGVDYLLLAYAGASYLPMLWQVDYVSGMDLTKVPRIIVDVICKLAAIDILAIMGNLIAPLGVNSHSLSVDGLSQSRSYASPPFKGLFDLYNQQLYGNNGDNGLLQQVQNSYFGLHLSVV